MWAVILRSIRDYTAQRILLFLTQIPFCSMPPCWNPPVRAESTPGFITSWVKKYLALWQVGSWVSTCAFHFHFGNTALLEDADMRKKKKREKKTVLIGEPETQETSTYRAGAFSFLCFLQTISAELHCFQLHWNKIYPLLRNGKEILLQPHTQHRELPTVLYFHAKGDVTMSVSRWYLLFLSWCSPGTPTLSAVAGWDKELPILCCPPLGS